jgi:hypothetical protein
MLFSAGKDATIECAAISLAHRQAGLPRRELGANALAYDSPSRSFALFILVVVSPALKDVRDVGSIGEYERRDEAQESREIRFLVHS